jgi:hypothetical protein
MGDGVSARGEHMDGLNPNNKARGRQRQEAQRPGFHPESRMVGAGDPRVGIFIIANARAEGCEGGKCWQEGMQGRWGVGCQRRTRAQPHAQELRSQDVILGAGDWGQETPGMAISSRLCRGWA